MAAPYTFKVRYMDDRDPFTVAYAEPTVPPTFAFNKTIPLIEQLPALIKVLNAPHVVSSCFITDVLSRWNLVPNDVSLYNNIKKLSLN